MFPLVCVTRVHCSMFMVPNFGLIFGTHKVCKLFVVSFMHTMLYMSTI